MTAQLVETSIDFLKKFPQTTEPAFYMFLAKVSGLEKDYIKSYIGKITEVSFTLGIIDKNSFDALAIWVLKTPKEKLLTTFELLKQSV